MWYIEHIFTGELPREVKPAYFTGEIDDGEGICTAKLKVAAKYGSRLVAAQLAEQLKPITPTWPNVSGRWEIRKEVDWKPIFYTLLFLWGLISGWATRHLFF